MIPHSPVPQLTMPDSSHWLLCRQILIGSMLVMHESCHRILRSGEWVIDCAQDACRLSTDGSPAVEGSCVLLMPHQAATYTCQLCALRHAGCKLHHEQALLLKPSLVVLMLHPSSRTTTQSCGEQITDGIHGACRLRNEEALLLKSKRVGSTDIPGKPGKASQAARPAVTSAKPRRSTNDAPSVSPLSISSSSASRFVLNFDFHIVDMWSSSIAFQCCMKLEYC